MRPCYCLLLPVNPTTHHLNTLDVAILGNLAFILILNLHITDLNTPIGVRQFCASLQMILIYLALLYSNILLEKKVNLKGRQLRCCQKQEEQREDNAESLLEAPAETLGNLLLIIELEDDDTMAETCMPDSTHLNCVFSKHSSVLTAHFAKICPYCNINNAHL